MALAEWPEPPLYGRVQTMLSMKPSLGYANYLVRFCLRLSVHHTKSYSIEFYNVKAFNGV